MHTYKIGDVVIFQHKFDKVLNKKCIIIDTWNGSFDFKLKEIKSGLTFPACITELKLVVEKKSHLPKWW